MSTVDKEIAAMQRIVETLDTVEDTVALERILKWVWGRYLGNNIRQHDVHGPERRNGTDTDLPPFEEPSDLFQAVSPSKDADKALVAGYWQQVVQGGMDFTGQEANSILKNLGHPLSNITDALGQLMRRKPSLVMQTRKKGTTKQGRKKYKLTAAGIAEIRRRISGQPDAGDTAQ